ncbi:MAG: Ig-like domain-containing protein, partial [Gemmatimonadetes bacterium]|nr:Ig-like domain-containing protein [Gemmatimonadota bacterium]
MKLSLRDNNVRGPLHSSIGLLERLVTLDLSRNWISGPILAEVGDLALLRDLTLSVNGFVGGLPSSLGTLDSLRTVNVAATSLSGLVPTSFEDLELESFLVGGTDLCVPPSLAEWLDSIAQTDDPPECASRVVVDPASLTFEASGDTATLSATVFDAEGEVVEDAEVTWKSGDTRVARVGTTGLVSARASGLTDVTATYDSVTHAAAEVAVRLSGGDRVALEALYRAMGGDDWKDNTNWMSDEPLGEWYGVDTWRSGRVRYLELQDNNVAGEIPAEIGLLDSLFSFKLRDATVTGPIPPAIGRLQRLRDLNLRETGVEGPLPPEMGEMTGLDYLSLSYTKLSGPLPATFADLDVSRIYLGRTYVCLPRSLTEWYESRDDADELVPCIPETSDREALDSLYGKTGGEDWGRKDNWRTERSLNTWSGITTDAEGYVTEIFLPWNNLTDSIPPELGDLARLEVLALYGNNLTGRIPPELGKLTTVTELSLSGNELEGPIPPEIGGMVSVATMWLSKNELSGPIPPEFGNLENLEFLALFENELSGPLPAEFGNLKKLKTAWMVDNKFEGPLPPELGEMAALEDLSLGYNEITGSLPPELGKLRKLKELRLSDNELTGPIPPELGDMAALEQLFLMRNSLSGSIPPELGKLSSLEILWIFRNDLTGTIPAELGNLSKLKELSIGTNGFTGSIPPELGQLSALEKLLIPRAELTGSIPLELGNLSRLNTLWLFQNELSGSIPAELGGLSALKRLELGDNQLTGSIPPELGQLSELEEMGARNNGLTGPLPPELGQLISLGWLSLRNNEDLEGLMPRSMMNLPLGYLDISSTWICPYLDDEFQEWLDGIPKAYGLLCPSAVTERYALMELYDSTGGDNWTDNDGWDSDSELDDWYGVTVEDSLVRELRLPANGLEGPLPPALGSLLGLETLDLADNDLTGGVAVAITSVEPLDTIRISENEEMEGPLPFRMVDLENLRALEYEDTDMCASPAPTFQEWIDALDVAKGATCDNPDSVRLSLPIVYLTQSIQSPEGDVQLISDRKALLRVFLVGDQENAFFEPEVFATFTRDGREVHRVVMPSEQDRVATFADEGDLVRSYNAEIPARYIRDDTEFVIVADSAEVIPRAEGSQTRFPDTGSVALDVVEVPDFELTIVPVLYADEPDSSVFDSIADMEAVNRQVSLFEYSFPIGEFTASAWDTAYVTSLDMTEEDNTWPVLLEVEQVYKSAKASGYWYAIADSDEGYVRGIARLNGLVSFGKPWATELAHEVGHTLDLLHAPCGGALGTDPEFPYDNGGIGVWGYD